MEQLAVARRDLSEVELDLSVILEMNVRLCVEL
jgi:hypothetical protein